MNRPLSINADDLAVVALGGNLPGAYGSVQAALQAAVDRLPAAGMAVIGQSGWWRSAAWPDPADPPFLNGIALVQTALSPLQTLQALRALESQFGLRDGPRNSPRVLDLDLIAHGRTLMKGPELTLPHTRAAERLFVMGPLAQIAPDWRHPVLDQSAAVLAKTASVGLDARPIGD